MYTTQQSIVSIQQINLENINISFNARKLSILNSNEIEDKLVNLTVLQNLNLDFTNVEFIDSTGFKVIWKLIRKSMLNDSNITFTNISPELKELFILVGLDQL